MLLEVALDCWCRVLQRKLLGGRVCEFGYADLSRSQLCVSCWPSGLLAVALEVWPAGNDGCWLGMVVSDTLAGYVSTEGDVNVR